MRPSCFAAFNLPRRLHTAHPDRNAAPVSGAITCTARQRQRLERRRRFFVAGRNTERSMDKQHVNSGIKDAEGS